MKFTHYYHPSSFLNGLDSFIAYKTNASCPAASQLTNTVVIAIFLTPNLIELEDFYQSRLVSKCSAPQTILYSKLEGLTLIERALLKYKPINQIAGSIYNVVMCN